MQWGFRALNIFMTGVTAALAAQPVPGDAERGAEVLRTQNCIACHSIRGEGGASALDLGKLIGRSYTPSWMASIMWNHAPAMWSAMEKQGIAKPRLTEPQAADLFAYFHSIRAFERPGDAARGKQVFTSKQCAKCHGIESQIQGGGPPVASWQSLVAPIALAQQMWNHASKMQEAMLQRGIRYPRLTAQELTDLLVYIQNLPQTRGRVGEFVLVSEGEGKALFKAKGCVNCHQGKLALEERLRAGTMSDFAVSMWNHSPRMLAYGRDAGQSPPALEKDEMRQIVAYLWHSQLYAERGNQQRGERLFVRKRCATCHNDRSSGAPDLSAYFDSRTDPFGPVAIVSVLWQHGPAMLQRMRQKNLVWPRFSQSEMVDLVAYLKSRKGQKSKN